MITRRDWLRYSGLSLCAGAASSWLPALAADVAANPARKRSCILLWMSGGPSQMDTFDLKPGHENGGPFQPIDTAASGVRISEHLPKLARQMNHCAILRGMSTKEGDHTRATYFLRTGYLPQGPVQYPTMGSFLSKELQTGESDLPSFVSIAPQRFISPGAYGPGFLGPQHAPLIVGGNAGPAPRQGAEADGAESLTVRNLSLPRGVTSDQLDNRLKLLESFDGEFTSIRPGIPNSSHRAAYAQAVRMMRSSAVSAFNLSSEAKTLRDAYGRNPFGQGCLLARRLVEQGVPFVEVSLNGVPNQPALGWDTHAQNFDTVKSLSEVLDPAFATLLSDLKERGLLESTLVVWMGEFGRTPRINENTGRDHFPGAWSAVLAGGGIRGGQAIGRTSADGTTVEDRPIAVPDMMATICRALGIDPGQQNISNVGRPIRLSDSGARPVTEALA
jgi:hypothetical protein